MNMGVAKRKQSFFIYEKLTTDGKSKKKASRRYSIRLFAAAGVISRIRRHFLYFIAIAIMALALCLLAPDKVKSKGKQTIQVNTKPALIFTLPSSLGFLSIRHLPTI